MDFQPGTPLAPATDERIQWFETTYRVKLPAAYVAVLKDGNGAVPVRRTFPQGKRERLIERMLCLLPIPREDDVNGWYDLSVVLSQLDARLIEDENLVGMNVIPFAVLFAGDFVCLDYRRSPETPSIAVWDHERSDDLQPVLETVAPTFAAFEAMLAEFGDRRDQAAPFDGLHRGAPRRFVSATHRFDHHKLGIAKPMWIFVIAFVTPLPWSPTRFSCGST